MGFEPVRRGHMSPPGRETDFAGSFPGFFSSQHTVISSFTLAFAETFWLAHGPKT